MRARTIGVGVLVVHGWIGGVQEARAQGARPTAADTQAALSAAHRGWTLYTAGQVQEALVLFREAEAKVHAPTFLLMIARCHEKLGRLTEARDVYRIAATMPLDAGASEPFVKAQADAKEGLAAISARIASIEVALAGSSRGQVEVQLDGAPVTSSKPVERDPGDHVLTVRVPGRPPVRRTVALREGAKERAIIDVATGSVQIGEELTAAPPPERRPLAGEERPVVTPPGGAARGGPNVAWVGAGAAATAIGAGVGIAFVVLANGVETAPSLDDCFGKGTVSSHTRAACDPEIERRRQQATYTDGALWGFLGGALAGGATLAYVLLAGERVEPGPLHVSVVPTAGGGGVAVGGRW